MKAVPHAMNKQDTQTHTYAHTYAHLRIKVTGAGAYFPLRSKSRAFHKDLCPLMTQMAQGLQAIITDKHTHAATLA